MIGNLVHYNCGGSKSIAIVTDFFRYEGENTRTYRNGDVLISVEWVKKSGGMPQSISPNYFRYSDMSMDNGRDTKFWPADWHTKRWYNLIYFKVISSA